MRCARMVSVRVCEGELCFLETPIKAFTNRADRARSYYAKKTGKSKITSDTITLCIRNSIISSPHYPCSSPNKAKVQEYSISSHANTGLDQHHSHPVSLRP